MYGHSTFPTRRDLSAPIDMPLTSGWHVPDRVEASDTSRPERQTSDMLPLREFCRMICPNPYRRFADTPHRGGPAAVGAAHRAIARAGGERSWPTPRDPSIRISPDISGAFGGFPRWSRARRSCMLV